MKKIGVLEFNVISLGIKNILNGYTKGVNKEMGFRGSIFTQNTKEKLLTNQDKDEHYPFICFNYIHLNPLKANLVNHLNNWTYSSFPEYSGISNNILCNHSLAFDLLEITVHDIENTNNSLVKNHHLHHIF
ncbi:MAG: hypothetical protein K1X55_12795 [Chitinophagales bacterium]|nr:hypothetical protein [Chitinophagales bacterium]